MAMVDLVQSGNGDGDDLKINVRDRYFQLCMGAGWGIEATPENLLVMKNALPPGVVWSVLGVGRMQLPMITMAMLSGGHVRVGFEDNIYLRRGELLKSNAQIVEVAANIIQQLQGEVANTNEAREILGLLKSIKETPLL